MRLTYERFLARRFPHLLRELYGPVEETSLAFGIECGDGWLEIIFAALQELEKVRRSLPQGRRFRIAQIKDKFGGLRIYLCHEAVARKRVGFFYSEETEKIISRAARAAEKTCMHCGKPARLRDRSYRLCGKHFWFLEIGNFARPYFTWWRVGRWLQRLRLRFATAPARREYLRDRYRYGRE